MTRCKTLHSWAKLLATGALLLLAAGCLNFRHEAFSQKGAETAGRHLYEPIAAGEQGLLEALAQVKAQPLVYELSPHKAVQLTEAPAAKEYWNEDRAVFYVMPAEAGQGVATPCPRKPRRLLYLSPRTLSVTELGQDLPRDGDIVKFRADRYSIFRALPAKVSLRDNLEVYRFDFFVDGKGEIRFADPVRITQGCGADECPVPVVEQGRLVFIHRETVKKCTVKGLLMSCGFDGQNAGKVLPGQAFAVELPRVLPNGALAVAANPDGYFRLYTVSFGKDSLPPTLTPLAELPQAPKTNTNIMMAGLAADGSLQPVLLELPRQIDLAAVCMFVAAHNPAINQRRAELAAALIESGMARLANWPTAFLGVSFEKDTEALIKRPTLYPGDIFTLGLTQGLLGFVQPLLDIRHNVAQAKAQETRAEVLRDLLMYETNARLTEAAEVYFEAQYFKKLVALEEHGIAVAQQRKDYYERLRAVKQSYRLQLVAAQQVIDNLSTEHAYHVDRAAFLKKRLAEMCGIPERMDLALADEQFHFEGYAPEPPERLRELALLNHPRVAMAEHALSEAYYLSKTKAPIRPGLDLLGGFTAGDREYEHVVSNSTTAGGGAVTKSSLENARRGEEHSRADLVARLPLASFKAAHLNRENKRLTIEALELEKEGALRATASAIEEDDVDFHAAQQDYQAKMASVSYYLEQLRVARVLKRKGVLESPLEVPLLSKDLNAEGLRLNVTRLTRDYPKEDTPQRADYLADVTAETELMASLANLLRVEQDLGVRFAHLWREMGLAARLPAEAQSCETSEWNRRMGATWLWDTEEVMRDDHLVEAFVRLAKEHRINRVYAYLDGGSDILQKPASCEKFRQFLNACYCGGIQLWGLLGEPEWLAGNGQQKALAHAIRCIVDFNAKRTRFEPKLEGLKLDLEPHSVSGWAGAADRARLVKTYIAMLQTARKELKNTMPLWVDCPVQYFKPENHDLLEALAPCVDGITLMSYYDNEDKVLEGADLALSQFTKPVQIGIEFSNKSPANERVSGWPVSRLRALLDTFESRYKANPSYTGAAFHDYTSVAAYWREKKP